MKIVTRHKNTLYHTCWLNYAVYVHFVWSHFFDPSPDWLAASPQFPYTLKFLNQMSRFPLAKNVKIDYNLIGS